jgi:hypothetical protein
MPPNDYASVAAAFPSFENDAEIHLFNALSSEELEKVQRDFPGVVIKPVTFEGDPWVYAVTMCPQFDTYYFLKAIL